MKISGLMGGGWLAETMRLVLALVLVLAVVGPSAAQVQAAPQSGGFHLGPVTVWPSIALRDVGIDSNAFNESAGPREDFTATLSPGLRALVSFGPGQLTSDGRLDVVYYRKYSDQRSLNGRIGGRFDLLFTRFQPFLLGEYVDTRERPSAEIDARARRTEPSYGGGFRLGLTARTALELSAQRRVFEFAPGQVFLDADLGQVLNRTTDQAEAALRFALTPLTTLVTVGRAERIRFASSPIRDSDTVRYMVGLEFSPDALLRGRAFVGYREFDPRDPVVPRYAGAVADVAVSYSFRGVTRFEWQFDRDVQYSFEAQEPYYVSTGGGVTMTQRIVGPVDVTVGANRHRLVYRALGGPESGSRTDRVELLTGGVGYRIGQSARIGFGVEYGERQSSAASERSYKRTRFISSITYGY